VTLVARRAAPNKRVADTKIKMPESTCVFDVAYLTGPQIFVASGHAESGIQCLTKSVEHEHSYDRCLVSSESLKLLARPPSVDLRSITAQSSFLIKII
jgi:hypothetical protein